ncbi:MULTISPECIES: ABC transporter ATP-binding protein [Salinibaculum]|uniref:ABC transporter ATP-binding protein n=1 Tax=Salinibaculum TaxID=2732368 RepID=UPI0030D611A7
MSPTLSIENVTKRYGALTAVDSVDIRFESDRKYGLIGPNGAGKTTLFDLISGVQRPDEGEVVYDGTPITTVPAHEITERGLARTFQEGDVFDDMTVIENLLAAWPGRLEEGVRTGDGLLEQFEMAHTRDQPAGDLSGGQKKVIGLVRTLMTRPEFVLLDEVLAGVNPTLQQTVLDDLDDMHESGTTFVMIEHDINAIMEFTDYVFALSEGQLIAEGTPEEVRNDETVLASYLGETA